MYQLEYLDLEENKDYENIVQKVVQQCFKEENLENSKLYISITLTTPEHIREINKQYRNIDKETDVLSFPMFEKKEIDFIEYVKEKEILFMKDDMIKLSQEKTDYSRLVKYYKRKLVDYGVMKELRSYTTQQKIYKKHKVTATI